MLLSILKIEKNLLNFIKNFTIKNGQIIKVIRFEVYHMQEFKVRKTYLSIFLNPQSFIKMILDSSQ